MNSSDHATDLRAARTDGVVKYRMRMCGSEAVPAIMQKARVTNFHLSIPPTVPLCGVFKLLRPGIVSPAGTPRPSIGSSSARRDPASPQERCGRTHKDCLLAIQSNVCRSAKIRKDTNRDW